GKCYAISGSSGKGKSTFGKIVSGHLTNYQGHIKGAHFEQEPCNADSKTLDLWRRTYVYIPQNSFAILNGDTNFIEEMNWVYQASKNTMPENSVWESHCEQLKLEKSTLYRPLNSLSGGERQKLSILQYLIQKPSLLILDEPTAAMDELSKKALLEMLLKLLQSQDMSIVILTHDSFLIDNADRRIEL
ncbi:MAG: hypothetical protein RL138_280, partial [Bacteroidota bacterium]